MASGKGEAAVVVAVSHRPSSFVNERKSENLIYVKFVVHFYELKGAAIPFSG